MGISSASRVQKHRAQLRAAGLRPFQIWVPDTRRPGFAEECRPQSLSLRDDPQEREVADWLEQAAEHEGWGEINSSDPSYRPKLLSRIT